MRVGGGAGTVAVAVMLPVVISLTSLADPTGTPGTPAVVETTTEVVAVVSAGGEL